MAYNNTASLEKLTCTNYVDFGRTEDSFGQFSNSTKDAKYLDVKLKVFKKADKKEFRLVQNLTIGEADFNHFMRLRNQLVLAADNFATEENFSPLLVPTMSKDMDEKLKLVHKVIDVVERADRRVCATLLRYNVD